MVGSPPSASDGGDVRDLWRYQLRRAVSWFGGFFVLMLAISNLATGAPLSVVGGLVAVGGALAILPVTRPYIESRTGYTFDPWALALVALLSFGVVALTFPTAAGVPASLAR